MRSSCLRTELVNNGESEMLQKGFDVETLGERSGGKNGTRSGLR